MPQILDYACRSVSGTLYSCEWLDDRASLVACGSRLQGTGLLQAFDLSADSLELVAEAAPEPPIRCSALVSGQDGSLATGSGTGELQLWQLGGGINATASVAAHAGMVNCIAASPTQEGSSLLATGGEDGAVKLWDPRCPSSPAQCFPGEQGSSAKPPAGEECWAVAFGDAHGGACSLLAGFRSGALRLLDLRAGSQRWATQLGSGVVAAAFDRPDIPQNKFAAACMDSSVWLFDARTHHPTKGYAGARVPVEGDSALWGCAFLPQNRELAAVSGGDGSLQLFKYRYPDQRSALDEVSGEQEGRVGSLSRLGARRLSEQPLSCLRWHPAKLGLFCCTALDQCLRVGIVTGLHLV